jgi:hypothetical protein
VKIGGATSSNIHVPWEVRCALLLTLEVVRMLC